MYRISQDSQAGVIGHKTILYARISKKKEKKTTTYFRLTFRFRENRVRNLVI